MKTVLFVGFESFYMNGIFRRVQKEVGKEKLFKFRLANCTDDVKRECLENPDMKAVILIGYITDVPIRSALMPNTMALVGKIREMLGDGVKIFAASPEESFNTHLLAAGCDEEIDLGNITARLCEII